jgi:hypothetical protein
MVAISCTIIALNYCTRLIVECYPTLFVISALIILSNTGGTPNIDNSIFAILTTGIRVESGLSYAPDSDAKFPVRCTDILTGRSTCRIVVGNPTLGVRTAGVGFKDRLGFISNVDAAPAVALACILAGDSGRIAGVSDTVPGIVTTCVVRHEDICGALYSYA